MIHILESLLDAVGQMEVYVIQPVKTLNDRTTRGWHRGLTSPTCGESGILLRSD